ncbi:unnamed protein product [Schistosoma margrebowiei]|uniref:Uncharacterized protein n=1 Tax=Schistosoma margrebowiei TaxID=48269 RepID=A0A183LU81_9TREM|nr:unnamed protein product [Schistosoma margrebowiei]
MVVGGSRQETLNLGAVLFGTHHQDVPAILRELVLPGRSDPVSPSFTIRDIKKLARRHAQESRQQSNRRMLINNPMINNEPMIRIQSPNSMLFNLRNPTISDIPYLYKTVDHCQDITSLQNEQINENDPDEILKKRMLSLATSCSPPFIHIPQVNQIENPYPSNISYISTTSKAMENSSLTFSTHELFPCLNSVCTNSKSSSLLSEVPFTPITSSGLMISNNNNNSNDNIHNNTNTTTNNNNVENNSTTNEDRENIDKILPSLQQNAMIYYFFSPTLIQVTLQLSGSEKNIEWNFFMTGN